MAAQGEPEAVLKHAIGSGASAEALACYARWWQFETYLREVVYTELRAKFGPDWSREVDARVVNRAQGDRVNRYMPSADAESLLSYADATVLFAIIATHWELFDQVLIPKKVRWEGQVDTLQAIRNRIAHCRRPHPDDLSRIEMALRDLESGARAFYDHHARTKVPENRRDPIVKDWVKRRHGMAARLIPHCEDRYETQFRLTFSLRPWAEAPEERAPISGHGGALWHAEWTTGARDIEPQELWRKLRPRSRELVMHLLIEPGGLTATFPAVEPASDVSEAIGDVFESLVNSSRDSQPDPSMEAIREDGMRVRAAIATLPPKVQYQSPFSIFDPLNPQALALFGV